MNIYFIIIISVLIGSYVANVLIEQLNIRHSTNEVPKEFEGYYNAATYEKSQIYLKETSRFGIAVDTIFTLLTIAFIVFGGFNFIDRIARSCKGGDYISGLIFAGILLIASDLLHIPFSAYATFVLEEKYGFNRTTVKTFILDILKTWLLTGVIGGSIYVIIIWFFEKTGGLAWLYCWGAVTLIQICLQFIAPAVILPLFNKFVPLSEGALKNAIENYARTQNFKLQGVFMVDGSRRSDKTNAFFTGFGKFRKIALFDTLIEKHSVDELVAILAHEIGHYKQKHIIKHLFISIITSCIMFFILSLFINNRELFEAFHMEKVSVYASLFFFGFLYAPIEMLLAIFSNTISRKHEFEADTYAINTHKKPEALILALKKLCVNNLSNLTPHPLKVFLTYSHPPVLARIKNIKKQCGI
jgi:STE24 endopeptidase